MRIEHLQIENYKGFQSNEFLFHPQFNLIVGVNGTGKTSLLDALSIALGSWFLGLRGYDTRHIRSSEVMLADFEHEDIDDQGVRRFSIHWEQQFPCKIVASGEILNESLHWERQLNSPTGRTTTGGASSVKKLAMDADQLVRSGSIFTLPLISYYGTGRLWDVPREQAHVNAKKLVKEKVELSRLSGYRNSVDPRLSVSELMRWIARQTWITFQQGGQPTAIYRSVHEALVGCLDGATRIYFDAAFGEVVVEFGASGTQPFNNLSDGQRCMLAMVGDIAQKAATLNGHLGGDVLRETTGVVLIDELDLHLHPKWQRRIIEDLRRTFPRIQFICTTHSPFLIQSLRSGEELISLDGQPTAQVADMAIGEIVQGIMGVSNSQVSSRYAEMRDVARNYLETLELAASSPAEKLAEYKKRLAESIAPYADNPAYQAFLEMKQASKLGS